MKRLQIYIDHDIIIRHFILNHTFARLEEAYDIQYVFPQNDPRRVTTEVASLGLKNVALLPVDRERLGMLRRLAKIRGLKIARENRNYRFVDNTWRKLFPRQDYVKFKRRSWPVIHQLYTWYILRKAGRGADMARLIQEFRPHAILHPTVLEGLFIADLAMLTREMGLPLVALMNSWDNPSTKAQLVRPPDWLVVWGEQTRQHAVEFLGMKPEGVKIMGAAQFQAYRQPPRLSREDYCALMGADPANKLILYAGSSKSINEMAHLQHLEDSVRQGALAGCHIVFRPHPWRAPASDEPDFWDIPWRHVSMDPMMRDFYIGPRSTPKVHLTSVEDTHVALSAIDLLISNMSTIMLEAVIHQKPVVCMISREDEAANDFLQVTLNSLYFQDLLEKVDIVRCENLADIGAYCRRQLDQAQDPAFRERLAQQGRYFIDLGGQPYGDQLREFIDELLGR